MLITKKFKQSKEHKDPLILIPLPRDNYFLGKSLRYIPDLSAIVYKPYLIRQAKSKFNWKEKKIWITSTDLKKK